MKSCLCWLNIYGDLLRLFALGLRSKSSLAAENLFLRKQLAFYQERKLKPRRTDNPTRLTLVWLSRWFDWRNALTVVTPKNLYRLAPQGLPTFLALEMPIRSATDGPVVCRMFNRAIAKQTPPKYLSSDNDPLFRFQRWLANLSILEVDEIKAVPCTPRPHAFVERLIGTVRREYLDQTLFWNQGDLEQKLENYKAYYNQHRCHTGLAGITPAERSGAPAHPIANLESYRWRPHCNGLFQTPAAA